MVIFVFDSCSIGLFFDIVDYGLLEVFEVEMSNRFWVSKFYCEDGWDIDFGCFDVGVRIDDWFSGKVDMFVYYVFVE